jgi:hypothetical protein
MTRRAQALRRGKVEVEQVRERDPDGRIVLHHRTVDAIGRLFRAGVIDEAMHEAAREFQAAFVLARLDVLRALPLARIPGSGQEPSLTERQVFARRGACSARWRRSAGTTARPGASSGTSSAAE